MVFQEKTMPAPNRQRLIRLIHVAKRDLSMDDDTYRAILQRIGKKASSADLTIPELEKVLEHLKRSGVTARRVSVDSRLLGDIRAELASGDMLAAIQTKLRKRLEETRAQADDLARAHGAEIEELDKQIGNLVDAISKRGLSSALSERLAATERRREDLQAEIARIEAATRVNLSRIPALYRQMAFQLERALKTNVAEAREVLRPLIDGARVVEEGGQVWVESETGRAAIAVGLSLGMVAGACITTTRRTLVS
jgi:phage gp16-like protein